MANVEVYRIESDADLQKAFDIRIKVFVDEQRVDRSLEYEFEEESTHFLALVDGTPAGTARWRETENGFKLERFAVLKEYRKHGVGGALVKATLNEVLPTDKKIYLNAQTQVVDFYGRYGFKPEGEEFEEAGIMHYAMVYKS